MSVSNNISEGFARYGDGDIVRFFSYALGSLAEVHDNLLECKARHVIDEKRFDELWDLAEQTKPTTLEFRRGPRIVLAPPNVAAPDGRARRP